MENQSSDEAVATSFSPVEQRTRPAPFWSTVQADVARFREEDNSNLTVIRRLLSQGFQALFGYRIFRWFHERRIPIQPIRFFVEIFIEILTGISLPAEATIGEWLRIYHFGGIIINSTAIIGRYCTIYQGVTLGDLGGWRGALRLGNRVLLGAGAKLCEGLTIEDDYVVGTHTRYSYLYLRACWV